MIYLDNAATSFPKAPGVAEAMSRFVAEHAANPGRSAHAMAVAAQQMMEDARLKLARMFAGDDHRRMVFAMNTTDALNMAIKGVLLSMQRGGHVITTVLEHNSVNRPLQALADMGHITLSRVDCDGQGLVDPEDIRKAITSDTCLIVMTHASNVLGTIQDAQAVGALAREHDVLFCLDAAQTAGIVPICIKSMHIDLLAFPGHKALLGPTGTGGLYVGERCPEPQPKADAPGMRPWREGGTGSDSTSPTQPALYPYFLEGGTPNTVGIAGLAAALDYLQENSMDDALAHERVLVKQIIEHLSSIPAVQIYGPKASEARVGTLAINIQGCEPADAGAILDENFQIAVRSGLHCAPYVHQRMGTSPAGMIRISPGRFSTHAEIGTLLDALEQMVAG